MAGAGGEGRQLTSWQSKSTISFDLSFSSFIVAATNITTSTEPRVFEILAFVIEFELHLDKVEIPWDRVAKRLAGIECTGDALKQAMAKRRDILLAEGHLIPPVLQKNDILSKLIIRGYTRDLTSDDPFTAVPVFWNQRWEFLDL